VTVIGTEGTVTVGSVGKPGNPVPPEALAHQKPSAARPAINTARVIERNRSAPPPFEWIHS
jgi:hypothetical protein